MSLLTTREFAKIQDDLQKYYASLLIRQYIGKIKATAYTKIFAKVGSGDFAPVLLQDGILDINGVGVQLELVAKILDIDRFFIRTVDNNISQTVNYQDDISQTVNVQQQYTLSDHDFSIILQFRSIQLFTKKTYKEIDNVLWDFFGNAIVAYMDRMQISYLISLTDINDNIIDTLIYKNLLPHPTGVGIKIILKRETADTLFFSYETDETFDLTTPYVGYSENDTFDTTNVRMLENSDIILL